MGECITVWAAAAARAGRWKPGVYAITVPPKEEGEAGEEGDEGDEGYGGGGGVGDGGGGAASRAGAGTRGISRDCALRAPPPRAAGEAEMNLDDGDAAALEGGAPAGGGGAGGGEGGADAGSEDDT